MKKHSQNSIDTEPATDVTAKTEETQTVAHENPSSQPPVVEETVAEPIEDIPQQNSTQEELPVEEVVAPKPKRIWEVDFVRGLMILFVVWDHFIWDISDMGPYKTAFFNKLFEFSARYYAGALRHATHDAFVTMFVFTSGVSCSFSRSNGKRAIKMMIFALLLTAVTYAASSIVGANITMYFNVIHVIALSVLVWTCLEWIWNKCNKPWHKNLFGVCMFVLTITALVVGYCAKVSPWSGEKPVWYWLAYHQPSASCNKFNGGDYLPFFPDFGWFLVGAFLGRILYRERKSLFPSVDEKWVSPFTFCGRYSIWIYFGSQVVMYGLLYLLSAVLVWI